MSEIVKYKSPAIEGEVLPPEGERERLHRDPMYFAANFLNGIYRARMEDMMTGAGPIYGEVVSGRQPLNVRTWNPSSLMRRMGYTANPDLCRHYRKAYDPQSGWSCRDCGEQNLTQKTRLSL